MVYLNKKQNRRGSEMSYMDTYKNGAQTVILMKKPEKNCWHYKEMMQRSRIVFTVSWSLVLVVCAG